MWKVMFFSCGRWHCDICESRDQAERDAEWLKENGATHITIEEA